MPFNKVEEYIRKNTNLINNLKSNPTRILRKCRVSESLRNLQQNYDEIANLIYRLDDDKNQKSLLLKVRQVHAEAKYLLEGRLLQARNYFSFKTVVLAVVASNKLKRKIECTKIAKMEEIIKLTSTLVPEYDGQSEKLKNITSALQALKLVVKANTEPVAIQVVLSKLTKKASSAVGENPANLDEIINKLKEKCASTSSSDTFFSKLKVWKQTGSLQKFVEEIESTTDKLEAALLAEGYSVDNAMKVATKAGIAALTNGVKKERTQLILEAGSFSKLSDAIAKAIEVDSRLPTASVLFNNRSNNFGSKGFNKRNNQNGYNGNNQNGYNKNNQNGNNGNYQQNNQNQNNGNGWNNGNSRSDRNNRAGRGGFNNHQNQQNQNQHHNQPGTSRQVFCNSAENGQFPQQAQVGGVENNQVQLNQLTNRQQNGSSR